VNSILGHLEEARKRLISVSIIFFIFLLTSFAFHRHLLQIFFRVSPIRLAVISPIEGFAVSVKISMLAAVIFTLPFIIYHFWQFIASGLSDNEKKALKFYIPLSLVLFIIGSGLAYFVIAPLGITFLISYAQQYYTAVISVKEYLSLITLLIIVFGLIFQLPLIILFLNRINLVSKKSLKNKRSYFYASAFIVGAILTPPDVITQISLAIPIILLYEFSSFLIR